MKSSVAKFSPRALMLALSLFLAVPASVMAQDGYWRNNQRRERRQERREERRERRQERRERRQQQRNDGYYETYGYRNDGYNNNNGYGYGYGNDNATQTALNAGYNEGIKEGRNDRQRGDRYDYRDEGDYQSATKDYSSRLGDRERYRQYFRQGFANGYRDGYNGY